MKKSILFIFALIPMLASCNNSENGFENPFPGDKPPIGFNIQEEGQIVRSLTSQETLLINQTIQNGSDLYKNIKEEYIDKKQRDYTRAFAGEFAQGYTSSNKKIDETQTIYRQEYSKDNSNFLRNVTVVNSESLFDYSYGDNTIKETKNIYNHFVDNTVGEECSYEDSKYIYQQSFINKEPKGEDVPADEVINLATKPDPEPENESDWYEPYIQISQEKCIFSPSETTSIPGVNKDGKPVLIKESHKPYNNDDPDQEKRGIYQFQDGRKYRATENELYVTRLNLVTSNDDTDNWYIVERSRHYSEIAITSDVIQPNVPISYLSNPIVIAYTEEIINFKTNTEYKEHPDLPKVEIPKPGVNV